MDHDPSDSYKNSNAYPLSNNKTSASNGETEAGETDLSMMTQPAGG